MKLLSSEGLQALILQPQALCLSILMPTHRTGPEVQQDAIRFRNLLRQAEKRLIDQGMKSEAVQKFLQPIAALDSHEFWQHQQDGLAIFRSEQQFCHYCLPLTLEEQVIARDHFYLVPILPLVTQNRPFYLLALSQQQLRLLQCTRYSVKELDLTDRLPTPIAALQFEAPERQVPAHISTPRAAAHRRGMAGEATIFHGHGAGDEDGKANLRQYFGQVDQVLQTILKPEQAPLVLAGVEYLLPIYREVNTYPELLENSLVGNPEALSAEELGKQAGAIVEPYFLQAQERAIGQYTELKSSDRAVEDIYAILPAAYQGRVHALLIAAHQQLWGTFNPETQTVNVYAAPELNRDDLLNMAAIQTLLYKGQVYIVEPDQMPEQTSVAAVLRY